MTPWSVLLQMNKANKEGRYRSLSWKVQASLWTGRCKQNCLCSYPLTSALFRPQKYASLMHCSKTKLCHCITSMPSVDSLLSKILRLPLHCENFEQTGEFGWTPLSFIFLNLPTHGSFCAHAMISSKRICHWMNEVPPDKFPLHHLAIDRQPAGGGKNKQTQTVDKSQLKFLNRGPSCSLTLTDSRTNDLKTVKSWQISAGVRTP